MPPVLPPPAEPPPDVVPPFAPAEPAFGLPADPEPLPPVPKPAPELSFVGGVSVPETQANKRNGAAAMRTRGRGHHDCVDIIKLSVTR